MNIQNETSETQINLICSFCQRPVEQVHRIIASKLANICNACVAVCAGILLETPKEETKSIVATAFKVLDSKEDVAKYDFLANPVSVADYVKENAPKNPD